MVLKSPSRDQHTTTLVIMKTVIKKKRPQDSTIQIQETINRYTDGCGNKKHRDKTGSGLSPPATKS